MKATGYVVTNQQEINEAVRLNLKVPDPVMAEKEILLPVSIIVIAFIDDGKIKTITSLGKEFHFKYDEKVWKRIEAHLEHL